MAEQIGASAEQERAHRQQLLEGLFVQRVVSSANGNLTAGLLGMAFAGVVGWAQLWLNGEWPLPFVLGLGGLSGLFALYGVYQHIVIWRWLDKEVAAWRREGR